MALSDKFCQWDCRSETFPAISDDLKAGELDLNVAFFLKLQLYEDIHCEWKYDTVNAYCILT